MSSTFALVQAVTFDARAGWDPTHALSWCLQHRLIPIKPMRVEGWHLRYRIHNPREFSHFTTKKLPGGIDLIIGWLA